MNGIGGEVVVLIRWASGESGGKTGYGDDDDVIALEMLISSNDDCASRLIGGVVVGSTSDVDNVTAM